MSTELPFIWVPDETAEMVQISPAIPNHQATIIPRSDWHFNQDTQRWELPHGTGSEAEQRFMAAVGDDPPAPLPGADTVTMSLDEVIWRMANVMTTDVLSIDPPAADMLPLKPPPPAPIPHQPLYVLNIPYPQPPRYEFDWERWEWVAVYDPPIAELTPRKAERLNKNYRAPTSIDDEDPEWDLSINSAEVCELGKANILTSDAQGRGQPHGGIHKVAIDVDVPAKLLPSSTFGHSHLYIDVDVPWEDYTELLRVLEKCGIIETGYARASLKRGYTSVRPPWVMKTEDERGGISQ